MSEAALEHTPPACGRCGNPYRLPAWGREYLCAACGQPLRPRKAPRQFRVSPWAVYAVAAVALGGAIIQFSLSRLNRRLPIVSQDAPAPATVTPPAPELLVAKLRLLEADLRLQPNRVALLRETCRHYLMLSVLLRGSNPAAATEALGKAADYARRLRMRSPTLAVEMDDLIRQSERLVWTVAEPADLSRRERRRRFYEEMSTGGTVGPTPAFPGGPIGLAPMGGVPMTGVPMSSAPMGAAPAGGGQISNSPMSAAPFSGGPVSSAPVGGLSAGGGQISNTPAGPMSSAPVGMAPAPASARRPRLAGPPTAGGSDGGGGGGGMIGPVPSPGPGGVLDPALLQRAQPPLPHGAGMPTPQQSLARQQWEETKPLVRELTVLLEKAPEGSEAGYALGQLLERQALVLRDLTSAEGGDVSPQEAYEKQLRKAAAFYLQQAERCRTRLDRATFLDAAANVYGRLDEWEEQRKLLERATGLLPYSARLWQELQSVYLRLGMRNQSFMASRKLRDWTFPTVAAP